MRIKTFEMNIDVPVQGYGIFNNVLSNSDLIVFSVPNHGWSELEVSDEWKIFQNLLEKFQKEHNQNLTRR